MRLLSRDDLPDLVKRAGLEATTTTVAMALGVAAIAAMALEEVPPLRDEVDVLAASVEVLVKVPLAKPAASLGVPLADASTLRGTIVRECLRRRLQADRLARRGAAA